MATPVRRQARTTSAPVAQERTAAPVRRAGTTKPAPQPEPEELDDDDIPEVFQDKRESREVAVRAESLPAPTHLKPKVGVKLGMEDLDADDLIIPYMKIMQPASPEVLDRDHEAQMGDLVNSLTSYLYPVEVYFVPIKAVKRRILFYKREDKVNSGIECGSMNFKYPDSGKRFAKSCATCPHSQFGADGTAPKCNILMSFISKVLELPKGSTGNELISITFTKTSLKAGRILASIARTADGNLFENIYKLTTDIKTNDKGTYAVLKVSPYGQVPDADVPALHGMYEMLRTTDFELVEDDYNEFGETVAVVEEDLPQEDFSEPAPRRGARAPEPEPELEQEEDDDRNPFEDD